MDKSIAIKVENISKVFPLRQPQEDENGNLVHEHWALKDVSFEMKKGESVGIIGPNGSGKSTLLKILAGVTKPTTGKVIIKGKVASILDIGAGFHPELSGRENVFLNGQIHGFSKKEITNKFDEIVDFSGIGEFIEEPVKNYSNGMYLRLAFSIMVHLDFDVYLFDEVFSVGDAEFVMKTKMKFQKLLQSDKTMVFVSHNINQLLDQNSYMLLEHGVLKEKTWKKNLLFNYLKKIIIAEEIEVHTKTVSISDFSKHPFSKDLKMINLKFYQDEDSLDDFVTDRPFFLEFSYEKLNNVDTIEAVLSILDIQDNVILDSTSFITSGLSKEVLKGKYMYICKIPNHIFNPQIYKLKISFLKNTHKLIESHTSENSIKVDKIVDNSGFDISLILDDIILFKPIFKVNKLTVDMINLNLRGGLLMSLEWKKIIK